MSLVSAILVLSLPLTLADELSYRVLEDLKVSCSPYDTCALGKRNRGATASSNCACDHLCVEYKDCCIDASYRKHHQSRILGVSCKESGVGQGVYVFNKCPLGWRGSRDVKNKCERRNNVVEDPLAEAPVTYSETDITYRNSYCAHCNGARGTFHHWNGNIACESLRQYHTANGNITPEYVRDNLVQSENKKKWGLNLWSNDKKKIVFYECDIGYELPNHLRDKTRSCTPNVVSECNRGWPRDEVQRHCESYMAVVYVNERAYKNPHCALCNFVSLGNRTCEGPLRAVVDSRKRTPMSFSLLLDINSNDGNTVGVSNSCPRDQAYDPYFKKCRPMLCAIPEYVVRYGKCVPP